jgi:hypothetical protein
MNAERAAQCEISTPHCDELPRLSRTSYIGCLNPHEVYAGHDLQIRNYGAQGLFHAKTQTISKFKNRKTK